MLRKRCVIWETCLLVFGVLFAFYLMGCNHRIDSGEVNEAENEKQKMKEKKIEEKVVEEIVEICLESYTKAEKEDKLDDLEMIRELLDKLGKNGYTAVDSENQMNMTEHEKLLQFCEAVEAKKRSHDCRGGFGKRKLYHSGDGNEKRRCEAYQKLLCVWG